MRTLRRLLVEGFLRFVPSRVGSDGLTNNERRVYRRHYRTGLGNRPRMTDDQIRHLWALASRTPPRIWVRPESTTNKGQA